MLELLENLVGKKKMSSEINLVMTVIGFSVSSMFIAFVFTRLICARLQVISTGRRSLITAGSSDLSLLECGLQGLEPVVVANLPLKKYGDVFLSPGENAQCTVCLADYHKEDILRFLPVCGHFFHAACVDKWLYQHSTCPVCRLSLRDLYDKKRFMQPMFCSATRSQRDMHSLNSNADYLFSNGQRLSPVPHHSPIMEYGCCQYEGFEVAAALETTSASANV